MISSQVWKNTSCCIFSWKTMFLFKLQIVKIIFINLFGFGTSDCDSTFWEFLLKLLWRKVIWWISFLKQVFIEKIFLRFPRCHHQIIFHQGMWFILQRYVYIHKCACFRYFSQSRKQKTEAVVHRCFKK